MVELNSNMNTFSQNGFSHVVTNLKVTEKDI